MRQKSMSYCSPFHQKEAVLVGIKSTVHIVCISHLIAPSREIMPTTSECVWGNYSILTMQIHTRRREDSCWRMSEGESPFLSRNSCLHASCGFVNSLANGKVPQHSPFLCFFFVARIVAINLFIKYTIFNKYDVFPKIHSFFYLRKLFCLLPDLFSSILYTQCFNNLIHSLNFRLIKASIHYNPVAKLHIYSIYRLS